MMRSWRMEEDWRFRWFLICCLLASLTKCLLVNAQSAGKTYVLQRESEVRAIVQQAVLNDAASCDLVSNCTASACSRAACYRLLEDNQQYQCVDVWQNLNCHALSGQGTCNALRANYKRSYVRVPGFLDTSLSMERVSAICAHRMLDQTFQAAYRNSSDGVYYNFYFGTVDGTFRFYPGTEVQDCNGFDPRIRPWYIGAISVLKDLVILVDVSSSMDEQFGVFEKSTALEGAQNITGHLLLTLTENDRATVLSYSTPSTANLLGQLRVTGEDGVNKTDPIFQQILELTVNASASVSNLATGVSQALQVFNGSASGALKVVLVLTNGKSPASPEELSPLLQQLNDSNIALFLYEIKDTDPTLATVACQVTHGHVETLDINGLQNPLFAVKSYFTFLAQSRNLATQNLSTPAFWQLPYQDFGFLGKVITVAYPAFSVDGQLIGVAGLDMQVALITTTLRSQITDFLTNNRIPGSPLTYPSGAPSVSRCPTLEAGSKLCNSTTTATAALTAVCKQTDYVHNYTDLLCCPGCGGVSLSDSHSSRLKWIIAVAAAGAVGVGVVAYFLWMWRCKDPPIIPPGPSPISSTGTSPSVSPGSPRTNLGPGSARTNFKL